MKLRSKHRYLWYWLVLALIIRLYKISRIYCIAKDGMEYIYVARQWLNGPGGVNPLWPPLYPWLISLFMKSGIGPELSGQLVSVVFGVLTVAMVYIISKCIFTNHFENSKGLVHISVILAVFHPFLVRYSAEVLADSVFTFLITTVVFCGWLGLKRKGFIPALSVGICTALAYLTKPEGIFLIIIISAWWLFSRKDTFARKLTVILCAWTVFLLLSFPYLYSIHQKTGRWMISLKQDVVFSANLQKEGYTNKFLDISPLRYAINNPHTFFTRAGKNLLTLLGRFPDAYNPLLFIFLIFGLTASWETSQKRFIRYILSFLLPYFLGYAVFHPGRRYLVNWVPLTLFLAAMGIKRITGWIPQKRMKKWLILITIIVLGIMASKPVRRKGIGWKEAGLWIRRHSSGKITVIAEDKRVAFYAGAEFIPWDKGKYNSANYIITKKDIPDLRVACYCREGVKIYRTGQGVKGSSS